jgi:hypothetical protein
LTREHTSSRASAITGLNWLGSQFQKHPGLVARCAEHSKFDVLCRTADPEDQPAAVLERLRRRAMSSLLLDGDPGGYLEQLAQPADKELPQLGDWLRTAIRHRVLVPVVTDGGPRLCWAEVTVGEAPPRLDSVDLAPWTFHWPSHGQGEGAWEGMRERLRGLVREKHLNRTLSYLISFQPLSDADFDGIDEMVRKRAAFRHLCPMKVRGHSCGLAILVAAKAAAAERALRRVMATGEVAASEDGEIKVYWVGGLDKKAEVFEQFRRDRGLADYFIHPLEGLEGRGQREDDWRFVPFSKFNERLKDLLTDGLDDYRTHLLRQLPIGPNRAERDLLDEMPFNAPPDITAKAIFNRRVAVWLAGLRTNPSSALAKLAAQPAAILCPLDDLAQSAAALPRSLADLVKKTMAAEPALEPPRPVHFEKKLDNEGLVLVVHPRRSEELELNDETRDRLEALKSWAVKNQKNEVVLVCDAHVQWAYDHNVPPLL